MRTGHGRAGARRRGAPRRRRASRPAARRGSLTATTTALARAACGRRPGARRGRARRARRASAGVPVRITPPLARDDVGEARRRGSTTRGAGTARRAWRVRSWVVTAPASRSVVSALYVVVRISEASSQAALLVVGDRVDPLAGRPAGPRGRGAGTEPGHRLEDPAPGRRRCGAGGGRAGSTSPPTHDAGAVEPGQLAVDGDAEVAQDVAAARRAVEGVRPGVEVEAVAVAAAGRARRGARRPRRR